MSGAFARAPRFATWLRCQAHRDDPVGDVARDASGDPRAPERAAAFLDYARSLPDACPEARAAAEQAVAEWRRFRTARRRKAVR